MLSIDRAYFDLTGGRERWLDKIARKHAGGGGAKFAISMPTLLEKTGAEGQYHRSQFELARIVERDPLPGYTLSLKQAIDMREPMLRLRRGTGEALRPTHGRKEFPRGSAGIVPSPAPTSKSALGILPERVAELSAAALIRRSVKGPDTHQRRRRD